MTDDLMDYLAEARAAVHDADCRDCMLDAEASVMEARMLLVLAEASRPQRRRAARTARRRKVRRALNPRRLLGWLVSKLRRPG